MGSATPSSQESGAQRFLIFKPLINAQTVSHKATKFGVITNVEE